MFLHKNGTCQKYIQDFSHIENLKSAMPAEEASRFDHYTKRCFETKASKASFKTRENNKIIQVQTRKTDGDLNQLMVTFQIVEKTHTLKNWKGAISDRFAVDIFEQAIDPALMTNQDGVILAYNNNLEASCPEPLKLNENFGDCLTPHRFQFTD